MVKIYQDKREKIREEERRKILKELRKEKHASYSSQKKDYLQEFLPPPRL